ncbi:MAG: tol-pal system protein YbgF [Rickettsiales bacterium]|nr:tol-pal system protein YbgF [Rickettsiales bacterium]
MFSRFRIGFAVAALCSAAALPSWAQEEQLLERVQAVEAALEKLTERAPVGAKKTALPTPASVEVRLSEIQVEMRQLRGQMEELAHLQGKLLKRVKQLESEFDHRMSALGAAAQPVEEDNLPKVVPLTKNKSQTAVHRAEPKSIKIDRELSKQQEPVEAEKPENVIVTEAKLPKKTPAMNKEIQAEVKAPTIKTEDEKVAAMTFGGAQAHYDEAFKALNQEEYAKARQLFDRFVIDYPKDELVGNAYYWLGETYFISKNYGQSALQYRKGFQALPDGPKAADNLLKLAMSLSEGKKNKEACVVLKQIHKKYEDSSETVTRRAKHEMARIKCE